MAKQTTDPLDVEYDALLFATRRSVRYHRHRQRFLDRVHDFGALLTAFAGAHELVFGTARAARRHDALAREFVVLEKELLRARTTLTSETLLELQTRRLDIEATEPPVYRVLDATCHDELVTALGRDETQRTNVTRVQRWLRHVVDIGAHRIRKHVN